RRIFLRSSARSVSTASPLRLVRTPAPHVLKKSGKLIHECHSSSPVASCGTKRHWFGRVGKRRSGVTLGEECDSKKSYLTSRVPWTLAYRTSQSPLGEMHRVRIATATGVVI